MNTAMHISVHMSVHMSAHMSAHMNVSAHLHKDVEWQCGLRPVETDRSETRRLGRAQDRLCGANRNQTDQWCSLFFMSLHMSIHMSVHMTDACLYTRTSLCISMPCPHTFPCALLPHRQCGLRPVGTVGSETLKCSSVPGIVSVTTTSLRSGTDARACDFYFATRDR